MSLSAVSATASRIASARRSRRMSVTSDTVEYLEEPLHVERLGQVLGRAGGPQLIDLLRVGVGADDDHGDIARLRHLAQSSKSLFARDVGQVHVQHDDVGEGPACTV